MGQALRLEVILLSKEKAAAPRPKPRGRPRGRSCGRPRGRCRGRPRGGVDEAGLEAQGGKTSKTFQTLNPLQNPPNTFPTGTPGPRPLLNQAPQGQGHSNGFLLAFKAAVCQPANTPNAPKPPNTIQNPPNPPGLEACFEQVAQGLWLVRRVHRRSKTISLPGRLEPPTLRLTASRSNQLSYGSLCRRPKLVPLLEKRLNNSWLQMVCQTKDSNQSKGFSKVCGKGSSGDNYTQPGSNWRPSAY